MINNNNKDATMVVKRTMTKSEMANEDMELVNGFAILKDNSHWLWDKRFDHWAMWKGGN